jgi:hypothetical protein
LQEKAEAAAKIQALARGRDARKSMQQGELEKFIDPDRKVRRLRASRIYLRACTCMGGAWSAFAGEDREEEGQCRRRWGQRTHHFRCENSKRNGR